MRIDQFLSQCLNVSRKDAKQLLREKRVTINKSALLKSQTQVKQTDNICMDGNKLDWPAEQYWMVNKPAGYCCSHIDDGYPSIFTLLPENKKKLHIAGRLDADTTGLLLVSTDGQWCHSITSPKQKNGKFKLYRAELAQPLTELDAQQLKDGILLKGEKTSTLPAIIHSYEDAICEISISEGRYHQVKRMFAAMGNRVVSLHRQKIAQLSLDEALAPGDYRKLSDDEIKSVL